MFVDAETKFQDIYSRDEELCKEAKSISLQALQVWNRLEKHQPTASRNIWSTGSLVEGTGTARIFQPTSRFPDGLNREGEADIEIVIAKIPEHLKHNVHDIEGKPGYVNVHVFDTALDEAADLGWKIYDNTKKLLPEMTSKDSYIKPFCLKTAALEKINFTEETAGYLKPLLAEVFQKDIKDVSMELGQSITKSSVQSDIMIFVEKQPFFRLSYDIVTLLKLECWPTVAQEWKERTRKWPFDGFIEKLSKFCYIITKPSPEEKDNEETVEMRYSFAHVERDLVKMRDPHQNKVYLIFKIMFVKFIKPIHPDKLCSFIAKTIMFWVCENFGPWSRFWNKDFDSIANALKYLFLQMKKAFSGHHLPYFFIKEVNVIEAIPQETVDKVLLKIEEILDDITLHLPLEVDKEISLVKEITDIVKHTNKIFDELKSDFVGVLSRQPELLNTTSVCEMLSILFDKIPNSKLFNRKICEKKYLTDFTNLLNEGEKVFKERALHDRAVGERLLLTGCESLIGLTKEFLVKKLKEKQEEDGEVKEENGEEKKETAEEKKETAEEVELNKSFEEKCNNFLALEIKFLNDNLL